MKGLLELHKKTRGQKCQGKRTLQEQQYHWPKEKTSKLSMSKQRQKLCVRVLKKTLDREQ